MNLRIKNPYILGAILELKKEKWFGADFFMSFFAIFIKSSLSYFVFHAVFMNSVRVDANQITQYYIIVNIVALTVQAGMYVAYEHMEDINTGAIIPDLLRPLYYPVSRYLNNLILTLTQLMVNIFLIFVISVFLGNATGFVELLLGFLSILLGFTVLYLIQAIIGCFTVWFHDITRFRDVIYTLLMALGGRLLPSDLLYSGLKEIIYYTPLPYVYDIPVKVLMGNAGYLQIGIQLLWILLLGVVYIYLFQHYVKHNIEFGG